MQVCSELQLAVDPYKCDNAKLVQENNRLHAELFETKETYSKQVSNLKKQIRKLENDNVDLQLRLSKNIQRIKEVEAETAKKSRRILELQGKCVKPTISNVSLGGNNFFKTLQNVLNSFFFNFVIGLSRRYQIQKSFPFQEISIGI